MEAEPSSRDLTVRSGGISLAGTLWLPQRRPAATVLMHPGSGPSDRDNDVFFPPIRRHLLGSGFAVCSFDKRGVGRSTGRWQDAAIMEQADDILAVVDALLAEEELETPVGLFGHSQGGWVVLEAAGRGAPVAFVVASSGPGVTPAEQERYAHRTYLESAGLSGSELDQGMEPFDELVSSMRKGLSYETMRPRLERGDGSSVYERLDLTLFPDDDEMWGFMQAILDYDPREALEQITVPVLALFGREDTIVPVDESVAVFRGAVASDLLTVAVFPGGDHRVHSGNPPELVDGYLETLSRFVAASIPQPEPGAS
jgi:uncharacterized protein